MSPQRLTAFLACLLVLAFAGGGAAAITESGGARSGVPLGEDAAAVDPADFVRGIDNRYFPLTPGTVLFYKGKWEGRAERDRSEVTRRTKVILGVKCIVVLDTVTLDGKPVERTFDWYAQDKRGNVWYFGEDSRDYAHGTWVASGGSWEAGVDGAKPGIIMEADPRRGDSYRQEFYSGHAEDMAKVLGKIASLSVPYGTFGDVLVTREWTPLEPGVAEKKYYAPGIGEVASRAVAGESEYLKLVAVIHR